VAHPLLDRRDMTAQRELGRTSAPGPVESHVDLSETNALLRRLVGQERARIEQLCVTDREPAQGDMNNFPAPGARRLIVKRTGSGGSFALTAAAPVEVVRGNEARLGGQIVVSGAGAVVLYLGADLLTPGGGTPLSEGVAQIWLNANGGSWDFRLGDLTWCGRVVAVAQAASSVTVAEV